MSKLNYFKVFILYKMGSELAIHVLYSAWCSVHQVDN
jgi:hypothetical protein